MSEQNAGEAAKQAKGQAKAAGRAAARAARIAAENGAGEVAENAAKLEDTAQDLKAGLATQIKNNGAIVALGLGGVIGVVYLAGRAKGAQEALAIVKAAKRTPTAVDIPVSE